MFRFKCPPAIVPISFVLTVILCSLVPCAVHSQVDPPAVVRIGHLDNVSPGDTITVPITLDSVGSFTDIGGFDLMVFFNNGALTYLGASLGDLPNGCSWEYFSARGDTSGLVRVVALAETNNGDVHPSCYLGSTGVLAELTFVVSTDPIWQGVSFPLFFRWEDCGDNVLAVPSGDTILVSDRVFKFDGTELTVDSTLPSYGGAPTSCLTGSPGTVLRGVDFIGGAVDLNGQGQPGPSTVSLQSRTDVTPGAYFDLALQYTPPNTPRSLGGFDFLLRYDRSALQFDGATQGSLLDTCTWEYFTFRADSAGPDGLVRLVAVADINDANTPLCYAEQPGTLATLSFTAQSDSTYFGTSTDIEWYWSDCSDNLMSNPSGDSIYFSADVYNADGAPIAADSALPGIFGAPQSCLGSAPNNIRAVDYRSGRVTFADSTPADHRGDVNLNGIPFEVADYLLFVDYFRFGVGVFSVDPTLQMQATDVNSDGQVLTLDDLVFLYELTVGLATPNGYVFGGYDTVNFHQDAAAQFIAFDGVDSIAAAVLTFQGSVLPSLLNAVPGMHLWSEYNGTTTRVVLYPDYSDSANFQPGLYAGNILSYTGNGSLVSAECADYLHQQLTSRVFLDSVSLPSIVIGTDDYVFLGDTIQIPIDLTNVPPGFEMAGFEFTIQYDAGPLTLLSVEPGTLLQNCGWEVFSWRDGTPNDCGGDCPAGLVKIISLADSPATPGQPTCLADSAGRVAVMTFTVSDSDLYNCMIANVQWRWYDCPDNSLSTPGGELLWASNVFDVSGQMMPPADSFPNSSGLTDSCSPGIQRSFNLRHGRVGILCVDPVNFHGDINLNGVAHEIADWVLFANYFVYGPQVFFHPETQVEASDVNGDGLPLTLEDLVFLQRLVIGDTLPYMKPVTIAPDTAIVTQDAATSSITIEYPGALTAAHFIFGGEVAVTSSLPDHDVWYQPGSTPYSRSLLINGDALAMPVAYPPTDTVHTDATNTGTGTLIHAEVASDGTEHIPVRIVTVNQPSCCQMRGNVNGVGEIDISDLTQLVLFLFGGGLPPGCPEGADVDNSGGEQPVTISDVTYLVSYLFLGGPAPAVCQ